VPWFLGLFLWLFGALIHKKMHWIDGISFSFLDVVEFIKL
jgi:hypothetical protein